MALKQYRKETLETWRTGRLGCAYMNSFTESRVDSGESSQLETISGILSTRSQPEQNVLLREIGTEYRRAARSTQDVERRDQLLEMLGHYIDRVILRE